MVEHLGKVAVRGLSQTVSERSGVVSPQGHSAISLKKCIQAVKLGRCIPLSQFLNNY